MNVADLSQKQWEIPEVNIRDIRQFSVVGVCSEIGELKTFGRDGKLLKFKLTQGTGDMDTITVAMWNKDVDTYGGLLQKGMKYQVNAPHVNQTRKEVRASMGAA